jgi:hypothetical protein
MELKTLDLSVLDGNVKDVTAAIKTALNLNELEAAEKAGKTRATVISAIEAERASRAGQLEVLLGSSVLPAIVEISEEVGYQLGEIVAKAHAASGLSVTDWNALPDDEREAKIAAQIEAMKATSTETPEPTSTEDDAEDAVNTNEAVTTLSFNFKLTLVALNHEHTNVREVKFRDEANEFEFITLIGKDIAKTLNVGATYNFAVTQAE